MNNSYINPELALFKLIPSFIALFLYVVYIIPKHMWGIGHVMPLLPLMPVFYWGKMQVSEIPYWFVFVIGIFMDVASGVVFGMTAFLYLIFFSVLRSQSKYIHKEGFAIVWGYFMVLLTGMLFAQWLIVIAVNGKLYAAVPAFIQLLVTISLYPLFHHFFDKIAEYVKQRRWAIKHG